MDPEVTGRDALFDTTAEDAQINLNELGSTSSAEGQVKGRNPATTTQKSKNKGKKPSDDSDVLDSSKAQHFQAILQLLQLVGALMPGDEHKHHGDKLTRDTRKSFDFVDAITNLMVNDEVVAAVACGGSASDSGHYLDQLTKRNSFP
jgi:hypothetical protein